MVYHQKEEPIPTTIIGGVEYFTFKLESKTDLSQLKTSRQIYEISNYNLGKVILNHYVLEKGIEKIIWTYDCKLAPIGKEDSKDSKNPQLLKGSKVEVLVEADGNKTEEKKRKTSESVARNLQYLLSGRSRV